MILLVSTASAQAERIGTGNDPVLYEDRAAWTDEKGVHIYGLKVHKEVKLIPATASHADIYGDRLVWHDKGAGLPRLVIYNISSGAKSIVSKNVDNQSYPKIYGNRIVWSSEGRIYLRDLSVSRQWQIANGYGPDIHETKIAYTGDVEYEPKIFIYDAVSQKAIEVSYTGDLNNPHVYGNRVIFSNTYNQLGYLVEYDMKTGRTKDLTIDVAGNGNEEYGADTGYHSSIYENRVAYAKVATDIHTGHAGIYIYDFRTDKSRMAYSVKAGNAFTTPEIYGNVVVWGFGTPFAGESAKNDIYIMKI